jgi:hypothetical protein
MNWVSVKQLLVGVESSREQRARIRQNLVQEGAPARCRQAYLRSLSVRPLRPDDGQVLRAVAACMSKQVKVRKKCEDHADQALAKLKARAAEKYQEELAARRAYAKDGHDLNLRRFRQAMKASEEAQTHAFAVHAHMLHDCSDAPGAFEGLHRRRGYR